MTYGEIEEMGEKSLTGNVTFTPKEASVLKTVAQEALSSRIRIYKLEDALDAGEALTRRFGRSCYETLKEKTVPFLAAVERAPRRVMDFLREIMTREPERAGQEVISIQRKKGMER